ncbi:Cytochrome C assembly protein [Anatilimnocola aggregata]|uniref:Cytochrome C assembly protein n=1 Tax=Anatilimnocola aggregata TaxID=2528021 RepID=A0A517Y6R9_9BACT|nr:cytochrome c biogenesis protein CcsA [Anatilimnocola aggregata]QDU25934.1 Cytochrome C assembly protein [Anatilimnocola aggregata]
MLSGITIVCFTASYAVALAMEVTRLFFRMPVRFFLIIGMTLAGLFAHTVHLYQRTQSGLATGLPLSSWYDWCLLAAWILAALYVGWTIRRPQSPVGLFMLPVVLALIGLAYSLEKAQTFQRDQALQLWGMTHGIMLLLGVVVVSLGFVAGLMYLVQSYRLKHKLQPSTLLRLPSLEWLESVNKQSLAYSFFLILLGLGSGIVMNFIRTAGQGFVPWTDPVVITSGLLLGWLLAATIFEWTYKPAQQGRKVAYLTVASFGFLAIVMIMLATGASQHAPANAQKKAASAEAIR